MHLLLQDWNTEHFAHRLQVYLLFPEFLKAEREAEPSVIRRLSLQGESLRSIAVIKFMDEFVEVE